MLDLARSYRDDREVLLLRSRVLQESVQMRAYKAEHQRGWEEAVTDELARRARAECDRVITTIFVNPKQFNNPDDLAKYPRTEAADAALLAGFSDVEQLLCLGLALWNGRDPILKERLFGLTNSEGNHGEDVKEYYFYLDSTPTHSYMKYLYKYPQAAFPYAALVGENRRRGQREPEYELIDTGVFIRVEQPIPAD